MMNEWSNALFYEHRERNYGKLLTRSCRCCPVVLVVFFQSQKWLCGDRMTNYSFKNKNSTWWNTFVFFGTMVVYLVLVLSTKMYSFLDRWSQEILMVDRSIRFTPALQTNLNSIICKWCDLHKIIAQIYLFLINKIPDIFPPFLPCCSRGTIYCTLQ